MRVKGGEEESYPTHLDNQQSLHTLRSFNVQGSDQEERIFLDNFLIALHRRLCKENWTFVKKTVFFIGNSYVIAYNVFSFSSQGFQFKAWIPVNNLASKIIFSVPVIVSQTIFSAFLIKVLGNASIILFSSREEQVLYNEPRSILKQFTKVGYGCLLVLASGIPIVVSLYGNFRQKASAIAIANNFATIPIYVGFILLALQIMDEFLLDYGRPLYGRISSKLFSKYKREIAFINSRKMFMEYLKTSFIEKFKKILQIYRLDINRSENYKEFLTSLEKLISTYSYNDPENINENLKSLLSLVNNENVELNQKVEELQSYAVSKKNVNATLTFAQVGIFLYFTQIGTSDILNQGFIPFSNSGLGGVWDVFYKLGWSIGFSLFTIINTYFFSKTISLFSNKIPDLLKCFFHRVNTVPVTIQHHRYIFALGFFSMIAILTGSLPSNTYHAFTDRVLGGYDHQFNFDTTQYTGAEAAETFYPAAALTFTYFFYSFWKLGKPLFNYVMSFFSNDSQAREILGERHIKHVIRMAMVSDSFNFSNIVNGMSDDQVQGVYEENLEDKLHEIYGKNGVKLQDDKLFTKVIEEIRSSKRDLEKNEVDEEQEEEEEDVKKCEAGEGTSNSNGNLPLNKSLSTKEILTAMLKIQDQERRSRSQADEVQSPRRVTEQGTEEDSLLPDNTNKGWFHSLAYTNSNCIIF